MLEDGKADDIVTIDLAGRATFADFMAVASGRSDRQIRALCEKLVSKVKSLRKSPPGVEGMPHGDWVLIDAGDVIVHLFRPEVRALYKLEKMWLAPLAGPGRSAALTA